MTFPGRRVIPRRLAYCFECDTDTVQWLTYIHPASPGSYRGVRLHSYYTCRDCGGVEL